MTAPDMPPNPLAMEVELKRIEAVRLRASGMTYREIATELHHPVSYAYQLVHEGLTQLRQEATEDADEARAIELARLDDQERRFRKKLVGQDDKPDEATGLHLLRITERRARLLGLDMPQEVSGPGGGPIPIAHSGSVDGGAGTELLTKVEKLMAQIAGGATPEQVAAGVKAEASAAATPETPQPTVL